MAYANKLHPFLMQGPYATLSLSHSLSLCRFLPFIQLQMLSYCIFALRPFKIPFEICRLISTSLAKSPQWLGLDFNVPATERETALKKERIERIDDVEARSFALQLSNLLTSLQMKCRRMRFHPLDRLLRLCVTAVLLKWLGFLIIWGILWKLFPGLTLFKSWWLD